MVDPDDDENDFSLPGLPRRRRRRRRVATADENVLRSDPPPPPRLSVPPPSSSLSDPPPRLSEPPARVSYPPRASDPDIFVPGLPRQRASTPGVGRVVWIAMATSIFATVVVSIALAPFLPAISHRLGFSIRSTETHAAGTSGTADGASSGARPASTGDDVTLPDLVRVPLANARSVADILHVPLVVRERRPDPYIPAEAVVVQSPAAGASVHRGQSLEVVVSTGPSGDATGPAGTLPSPVAPNAPAPTPSPSAAAAASPSAAAASTALAPPASAVDSANGVIVPRLVGQRVSRARAMLEAIGLRLGARRETFDPERSPLVVLWQSRSAGARVSRGAAVDVSVNQGE